MDPMGIWDSNGLWGLWIGTDPKRGPPGPHLMTPSLATWVTPAQFHLPQSSLLDVWGPKIQEWLSTCFSYAIHMLFICNSCAIHMLFICDSYDCLCHISCFIPVKNLDFGSFPLRVAAEILSKSQVSKSPETQVLLVGPPSHKFIYKPHENYT